MRDYTIRHLLQHSELLQFISDPHSLVVEELHLPVAKARIDIAVINGHLHGYEIKSASDTLQRLPSQIIAYSKVFDYLTIVTELKYHEKVLKIIPDWVGVAICSDEPEKERYEIIIPPVLNVNQEGFYIAKLLWYQELIELHQEQNIPVKKATRVWLLCESLAENIETTKLSELVRAKLKKRTDWKLKEGYQLT